MSTSTADDVDALLAQESLTVSTVHLRVDCAKVGEMRPLAALWAYRRKGWMGTVRTNGELHLSGFMGTPAAFFETLVALRDQGAILDGSALLVPVALDETLLLRWSEGLAYRVLVDDPTYSKILREVQGMESKATVDASSSMAGPLLRAASGLGVDAQVVLSTGWLIKRHTVHLFGPSRLVHILMEEAVRADA